MQTTRRANKSRRAESAARTEAAHEEARRALAHGCPTCGRAVKPNLALTGWVQCEQFGSAGFRKDATAPACNWQGFTHH